MSLTSDGKQILDYGRDLDKDGMFLPHDEAVAFIAMLSPLDRKSLETEAGGTYLVRAGLSSARFEAPTRLVLGIDIPGDQFLLTVQDASSTEPAHGHVLMPRGGARKWDEIVDSARLLEGGSR